MSLYDELIAAGLQPEDFGPNNGIVLRNDSDGIGDYIQNWNSSKPIPTGFTVGKPGGN